MLSLVSSFKSGNPTFLHFQDIRLGRVLLLFWSFSSLLYLLKFNVFCHLENHEKSWKVTKSPQAAPRIRPAQVSAPRWAFHLQQPAPGRHQRAQTEHPNEDEKILFKKELLKMT